MADNVFNIKITAVDNATKVVNKVNKTVSQVFRPWDNAKKSTQSFLTALGKNDLLARPAAGLQFLGESVGKLGATFGIAENSILASSGRIAASLGTVGGPIGAFVAAGVAAAGASAAVAVKMGDLGFNIDQVSRTLGVSKSKLQEYRGAAKLAGLETQNMDSGLASLGMTMQDALAGRNQQAQVLFTQMGLTIKRTKDGAIDTASALRDVAGVLGNVKDANMQRKIADMLGLGELLPLLRQGTGALDAFIEQARKAGVVMGDDQVDKNKKNADSWNSIKTSIDGMGVSIGNAIADFVRLDRVSQTMTGMAERMKGEKSIWSMWGHNIAEGVPTPMNVYRWITGDKSSTSTNPMASGKVTDAGGARGLRNNNPGNLRSWPGAASDGGYAVFPTASDGLKAAGKNLLAYQDKYGIDTISKIVSRWSPAGDGNNVPAYIAAMSKQTGFGADQKLNLHDPNVLAPLLSAITKQENGQNPYDADAIAKAAVAAVQEAQGKGGEPIKILVEGLPAGLTVKATRGLGQPTVGVAMAPGGGS